MSCAADQSVSFTFQGIRALAKTMKKSGQPVYFCSASHSVEDILQGADPSETFARPSLDSGAPNPVASDLTSELPSIEKKHRCELNCGWL